MIPPNYKSYFDLNLSNIERVQVFLGSKYIFTIGIYKKEMGFYIDFPKFNKSSSTIAKYTLPRGQKYIEKLDPSATEQKDICPKLSFHESGWVLLSKTGFFFNKTISRQKTNDSIFDNDGSHVFTISLQNLNFLPDEPPTMKTRTRHISLPSTPIPQAIKFVGNLWKKSDLQESFKEFGMLKNETEYPIVWPRNDGSNLGDIVFILKFCHLENTEPLYLSVRCMTIPVMDKEYTSGVLLTLMSGFIFSDIINTAKETDFISFIAKKENT